MHPSRFLLLPLLSLALVAACSDDPETGQANPLDAGASETGDAGLEDVSVTFAAAVGDAPFSCADSFAVGTPATRTVFHDLRVYVHDVELLDAAGGRVPLALTDDGLWQNGRVALLDFENGADHCRNGTAQTNVVLRGKAPAGAYRGLAFRIGVPEDLNHQDPSLATSPLTLSTLQWTWNAGYIFLRVDAETVVAADAGVAADDAGVGMGMGGPGSYLMHLGSAGCSGEAPAGQTVTCSHPNRGAIELQGFDPRSAPVVLDVGALFARSDLGAADRGGAPGCMSSPDDPECTPLLPRVGVDVASGAPSSSTQALFRAP